MYLSYTYANANSRRAESKCGDIGERNASVRVMVVAQPKGIYLLPAARHARHPAFRRTVKGDDFSHAVFHTGYLTYRE